MKILLKQNKKFKSYDENKQFYIIKNLIKAGAMGFIFIFFITTFIPNILNGVWVDSHNRLIGVFYVSNDLAGLFAVPNLPSSTKFHHYTSITLFAIICLISTENEQNLGRLIVIYTIFSCIPYLVNSYLALRFFYNRQPEITEDETFVNKMIDLNRKSAYYLYLLCCICNWIYHTQFLITKLVSNMFTIPYIVYYILLMPIVNDDIILLRWLKDNRLEL